NVDFLLPNVSLGLVRGSGGGNPRIRGQAEKLARNLYDALFASGLLPAVIDEADAAYSLLAPYSMVLLPYPETIAPDPFNNLLDYLRHGGKVGAFHALPPRLAALMDLPVGKFQSLPKGSLAWLVPDTVRLPESQPFRQSSNSIIAVTAIPLQARAVAWWTNAEGQTLRWPAILEAPTGFWMTQAFLNQDTWRAGQTFAALVSQRVPNARRAACATLSSRAELAVALAAPEAQRKAARSLDNLRTAASTGKYTAVALASFQVMNDLRNGTVRVTQGRANEIRAVWCRYSAGLPGQNWESTIAQMAGCGLNTLLPLAVSPFSAAYPSRLVRQTPGEGLPECVAAAGRRGMAVHAWMNCLGVEDAPETILATWEREGRLQRSRDGKRLNWLCPSSIENQRLLVRLATEVASQAPVYGVHFDRLRYPSSDACHCDRCRKAFAKAMGVTGLPNWPRCTANGGAYRRQWLVWRTGVIDQLLVQLSNATLTARPRSQVSVAVYPDSRNAQESVGQDWGKWCRSGWVSFVCPMSYRSSSVVFAADIARAVEVAGKAWVVPGIGVGPAKLDAGETSRQINAVRAAGVPGFAIFDLSQVVASEILPALQLR
ncbi:MAG: family 10 glycosylhydrolase, partial [Victivallales bacterium]|nr:family 10 glycosylhydrolase [Victivallales bacterium]